jgi:hypothetical protein
MPLRLLRQTRWAPLLGRDSVRRAVARSGDGVLRPATLRGVWSQRTVNYRVTTEVWDAVKDWEPDWDQTSRPGANLVLQLNLPGGEGRWHRRVAAAQGCHPFERRSHPIRGGAAVTLAWARVDVAEDWREVLIEEVQSDVIRGFERWANAPAESRTRVGPDREAFAQAAEDCLERHANIWAEAVVLAALQRCARGLGLRRVFFHTPESHRALKGLEGRWQPPRSLYTSLPRRFGFELTTERPDFLWAERNREVRRRMAAGTTPFWLLRL